MASNSMISTERSMIVEAHLTEVGARELYEAAQRLRKAFSEPVFLYDLEDVKKDVLRLTDFIQENI